MYWSRWKPVLITPADARRAQLLPHARAVFSSPFDRQIYGAEQITHVEPIVSHSKSQTKISN